MPFDLDTFIADCLAAAPDQAAVAEVVKRTVNDPAALEDTFTRRLDLSNLGILHYSEELTVQHVVFPPAFRTGIHDHLTWAVAEGTPKSDRARVIAIAPTTVSALRMHRKDQLEERLAWGEAWQDSGYVFTQGDGTPVRPDAVTRAFEAHVIAAALPRIRLHDLRHTHATLGLAAGIPPKVMSERLRHAKIGITLDLYSHVAPGMQEEAAAKLEALLFG
jgi:integrase